MIYFLLLNDDAWSRLQAVSRFFSCAGRSVWRTGQISQHPPSRNFQRLWFYSDDVHSSGSGLRRAPCNKWCAGVAPFSLDQVLLACCLAHVLWLGLELKRELKAQEGERRGADNRPNKSLPVISTVCLYLFGSCRDLQRVVFLPAPLPTQTVYTFPVLLSLFPVALHALASGMF